MRPTLMTIDVGLRSSADSLPQRHQTRRCPSTRGVLPRDSCYVWADEEERTSQERFCNLPPDAAFDVPSDGP